MHPAEPTPVATGDTSFHLRWLAQLALGTSLSATLVLAAVLLFATDSSGQSYAARIAAARLTQSHIGPALYLGGMLLLVCNVLLAAGLALAASFRVAGPLFRLTQNLRRNAGPAGAMVPVPTRRGDRLQAQTAALHQAVDALQAHQSALRAAALRAMRAPDDAAIDELRRLLDRVRG